MKAWQVGVTKDMRRVSFVGVTLVVASCAQIVGMEEGVLRDEVPVVECEVFENCVAEATECRVPVACNMGTCEFTNTIRGKPVTAQIAGDCKEVVCNGNGASELIIKNDDVEDDKNECTADSCNGGDVAHVPILGKMITCYDGPPEAKGVGICVGGMQACDAQGQPISPCDGQVLPQQTEVCDASSLDENCNGTANETGSEGGTCTCGDMVISPGLGEVCDDGNVVGGDTCSPICSPVKLVGLASGGHTSCARFDNDTVKCWGYNSVGQLGIGSIMHIGAAAGQMGAGLAVTPLPAGKKPLKLNGQLTFCALLDDQGLRCWGGNEAGQLGEGNTMNRGDAPNQMGDNLPTVDLGPGELVTDFAVGSNFVCAIVTGGAVKCWGANGGGQLGQGNLVFRGNMPGQMGANVPAVSLGTNVTAKQIAAGLSHTCVIVADDRVKCWGANTNAELGIGDIKNRGGNPIDMGDNLPYVDLGTNRTAKAIATRGSHTCVILDDGSVKCWGINVHGQLGLGDTARRGANPLQMGDNLPAVDLGTGRTAVAIVAHFSGTCALLDDTTVKCWGFNGNGNLGVGDTMTRGNAPGQMGDNLPAVDLGTGHHAVALTAGNQFTCAMLDDTSVKCWGQNADTFGRLGLGDQMNRGDKPNQMGDNLPIVKLFADTW